MQVYQTDENGVFVGITTADPDPLTPGNWLTPKGAVVIAPPTYATDQKAVYVNGAWEVQDLPPAEVPPTPPTPEEALAAERASMSCTPMQGILTLGEANWNLVLDYRNNTGAWVVSEVAPIVTPTTWAQKVIIDSAQTWVRGSQNIAFFQYLLNFTDSQVDDLFRVAATIDA